MKIKKSDAESIIKQIENQNTKAFASDLFDEFLFINDELEKTKEKIKTEPEATKEISKYNSLIKSYNTIIRTIKDTLSKEKLLDIDDDFWAFKTN